MTTTSTAHRRNPPLAPGIEFFVDTVYWTALIRQRDEHRRIAREWQEWVERRRLRLLTTEAVFWEALNGCSHPSLRRRAAELYRFCQSHGRIGIVPFTEKWGEAALLTYENRKDKAWSL